MRVHSIPSHKTWTGVHRHGCELQTTLYKFKIAKRVLPMQSACPLRIRFTVGWETPIFVAIIGSLHLVLTLISLNVVLMSFSIHA